LQPLLRPKTSLPRRHFSGAFSCHRGRRASGYHHVGTASDRWTCASAGCCPATRSEPAPVVATAPAPQPATPGIQSANTPVGVWLTEEKEGKVRIEQCGANLCGYSVDNKSNQNGEQILINMKPAKDSKWSGRIHDPKSGSTYDSTIALKGSDTLRVQGCASAACSAVARPGAG